MPDTRTHRGAHPEDTELFSPSHVPSLQIATAELCWLLDRGYALRSSLALTGDRHRLTERQRLAVKRCVCSRDQRNRRAEHEIDVPRLRGRALWIDGYNLLITVEAALGGGIVLVGRDRCCRDMSSLHGSYREVAETVRAAELIGEACERSGVAYCRWLLDRPVGNSGRLKSLLTEIAVQRGWSWDVDLEFSPDQILSTTFEIIASSDSLVLDRCDSWFNLARTLITGNVPHAAMIELTGEA